jgi:hypothetical protein
MERRRFLGAGFLRPRTSAGAGSNVSRRVRSGGADWTRTGAWKALGERSRGALTQLESPFASSKPVSSELLPQLENPYFVRDKAWATQSTG